MSRNTLLLLFLAAIYTPSAGAQFISCIAIASEKPVRALGTAETVSDITIECRDGQPTPAPSPGEISMQVTLNVPIANSQVIQGSNAVDAIAIVNENNCSSPSLGVPVFGGCGAPDPSVQDPQYALPMTNNRLAWTINLPAPSNSPGNVTTVRLTGIKANTSPLGANGGTINAFVTSTVSISNSLLTVARATNRPIPAVGVFFDGSWFLDRNGDCIFDAATEVSSWGSPTDIPVLGDWNGDGIDDMGVFSGGTWFIDANGDQLFDAATEVKGWGVAGWIPIVGDWNGDGISDLGAIDPATMTWFRDMNGDFAFTADTEVDGWGSPGDIPMPGDWDGDGDDDLGVFSGGNWFIDFNGSRLFEPASDIFGWGVGGWIPVVGDWNGDGADDLGAIEPSTFTWFRDMDGNKIFNPATDVVGWGSPGDTPVVADWDADGNDDVGVFSGGNWIIDLNGNQTFQSASEIKSWGVAGWTALPGIWQ